MKIHDLFLIPSIYYVLIPSYECEAITDRYARQVRSEVSGADPGPGSARLVSAPIKIAQLNSGLETVIAPHGIGDLIVLHCLP